MATKDFSSKQEKMIAEKLGWTVVAGSGAAACHPGDVIGDDWLGECKTHTTPGHKLFFSKSVWDKIKNEAMIKRRFPILFVDDGTQKSNHTWCLLPFSRLDLSICNIHRIDKGVRKNISIDGEILGLDRKKYILKRPGMYHVFFTEWDDDSVAIVALDDFVEMFRE